MDPRGLANSSRLRQFGVEAVELDNGRIKLVQITWFKRKINILQMMITIIDWVIKSSGLNIAAQNACEPLKTRLLIFFPYLWIELQLRSINTEM